MNTLRSLALLCAATLAGCAHAAQQPSTATPATQPTTDQAQLKTQAQAIVDAFVAETVRVRGAALGTAPVIAVENTPQLISYDFQTNALTVPQWEAQPAGLRPVFGTFAGGGDAEAEHLFRAFFNRFLVAHEAGHWFQYRTWKGAPPQLYALEQDANLLAVAFWRTQPGGEDFLAELERLANRAVAALPDPTPKGEDAATYFGAHYQELGSDPLKYGYYQFRFMADALRIRSQLDFARMAGRDHSGNDAASADGH